MTGRGEYDLLLIVDYWAQPGKITEDLDLTATGSRIAITRQPNQVAL